MARITDMLHAGKCRIALLDRDYHADRLHAIIVNGLTFDATPGTANIGGARKLLTDSVRIDADARHYPDAFFIGKEAVLL